ncbi:type II CRISPR RNA-guided endonuclease Cas9 [Limnohabitans sp. 2KL-17]|uniref:type II CRISPR RNA-guided endonuclease Cas9 n=1 Tax=Limnohabitans sp. 2KL-17 TaxID=1100704 RepID=UPI001E3F3DE4|nr:type II CRISPR RNA-guided endonuclease Cas9 [Limnohabitans sp. 2KL-17]
MRYRLALDLGSTSLGWAMVRLNAQNETCAVIKAGVRIFSDGRNPKDGSSLAVSRREARAMRRRRDRLLKRKNRMMTNLLHHGFFPQDETDRKALETKDPFALRAKGLDQTLLPEEFARALFHINQRRGFKSNRKTDKTENDSGALKKAIGQLREAMQATGCRTVGEWLNARHQSGLSVRARYRENRITKDDGKTKIEKSYDLYIDRAMIEAEFDALWAKQSELNPALFHETARAELKDCLLHQRPLKPVKPGRCTLLPDEERAPLALPSQQRFRIYQEVNNLRLLREGLNDEPLTLSQRDLLIQALDANSKRSFTQIQKLIGFSGKFNLQDEKRTELKGNSTSALLGRKEFFGPRWSTWSERQQDAIVKQLVSQEYEDRLIKRLQKYCGVDEATAETIANAPLPEGYGSLSVKALEKILPALRAEVITYDKAVLAAGFDHHSHISHAATGEILPELPYYGQYLQRHVGFGSGKPEDTAEKRYGKIANPTVHIGLNQVRTVVNALIKRYGHPSEVIVELARDLKQSQEQRQEEQKRQADNQRRNERMRQNIADLLNTSTERVRAADLQKMILWEELSFNTADRRCPYSGVQISAQMLFSDQVEIEHILPFSQTLDDSLNNKTVAMRQANRVKGNRTPADAAADFASQGWPTEDLLHRASLMPKGKRYRFAQDGMAQWLREDKGFLARALNDTRHLSRVAREYLSLICPQGTRVIPGRMTAMLRAKFGLNDILGLNGEKNRNDHRHHAVDACVIAVTDQRLLQKFATASASTREKQLNKLVETMPLPWDNYRDHVQRAVDNIWVSHKPDHGHEGAMHNDTAYGLLGGGHVQVRKRVEGVRTREISALKVIEFSDSQAHPRHGLLPSGEPRPYKGYKGNSNYCMEIVRNDKGKWEGEVVSTFDAYQLVRQHGLARLRHPTLSVSGRPLVMRLMIGDTLALTTEDDPKMIARITTISGNGQIFMAAHNEANVDFRNRDKSDPFAYVSKMAGSLQKAQGRRVGVSPIGELRDPGAMF